MMIDKFECDEEIGQIQEFQIDLDDEPLPKIDLSAFKIVKGRELTEESSEVKDYELTKEDIVPQALGYVVDTKELDINIEIPDNINEIVSNTGEILENYISGDAKFKNTSQLLEACIQLAILFIKVNKLGGCFNGITARDILITSQMECFLSSKKNLVAIDYENEYAPIKNKYCAPEVIREEDMPNEKTDIHTMAYIMFGILFRGSPFEGSKLLNTVFYNEIEEIEYYKNPIFVYSYKDKSNAPVYGIHSKLIYFWNKYYSEKIKMMFKQIFVEGVEEPSSRAEINTIIEILAEYKQIVDSFISENEPEEENKLEEENEPEEELEPTKKFNPEPQKQQEPLDEDNSDKKTSISVLKLNQYKVVEGRYRLTTNIPLTPGSKIKNIFIGYKNEAQESIVGIVVQNASDKSILGIKNLSEHTWIARKGDVEKQFPKGKVVIIKEGIEIDFYPENREQFKNRYTISN